jgi:hypothetical protein
VRRVEEWYRSGEVVVVVVVLWLAALALVHEGRLGADFRSLPTTLNAGKSFEEHGLFRFPKSAAV